MVVYASRYNTLLIYTFLVFIIRSVQQTKIVDKNMMLTDSESYVRTEGICKQTFYVDLYFQEF